MGASSGIIKVIEELLPQLEAYAQAQPETELTLAGFMAWHQQRVAPGGGGHPLAEPEMTRATEGQADVMLTILITYLYRYAKHYGKKALAKSPLSTLDEFSFLATLRFRGDLTKTELIQVHLLELTSGIEIIKRLSRQGLVAVYPDPADRRSRRVRLTPAGAGVLEELMGDMNQVAQIVSGNLGPAERAQLMPLLHQLNAFHAIIYQEDRRSDLPAILEKYLG